MNHEKLKVCINEVNLNQLLIWCIVGICFNVFCVDQMEPQLAGQDWLYSFLCIYVLVYQVKFKV